MSDFFTEAVSIRRAERVLIRRIVILVAVMISASIVALAVVAGGSPATANAASFARPIDSGDRAAIKADFSAPEHQRVLEAALGKQLLSQLQAREAAAAAAELAAAEQAAQAKVVAREAAASSGTLNVWTSGGQLQINECRGGVDTTAAYGTPTVAEHWVCGGSSFPTTAGSIVTFTGLDAGVYRVIGVVAVLNASTAHASNLPRGYQMLFQTCRNNNSATTEFIGLQKIG